MSNLIKNVYIQNDYIVIEKLYNYHLPYIDKIALSKDEAKALIKRINDLLESEVSHHAG